SPASCSYRQPPCGELRACFRHPVAGGLPLEPLRELHDPGLERYARLIAEYALCTRNVGEAVADVADPVLAGDLGLERDAEDRGEQLRHFEDRIGAAAADVDRLAVGLPGVER